jgi:hypothetical protein
MGKLALMNYHSLFICPLVLRLSKIMNYHFVTKDPLPSVLNRMVNCTVHDTITLVNDTVHGTNVDCHI